MEKIKDSESCSSRDIAREDFELQREKKQLVGLELWGSTSARTSLTRALQSDTRSLELPFRY